jgi:hypothetical protein
MVSKEAQVAFNLKKGSLPIRGDIDLAAANDCMKKGLEILATGNCFLRATRFSRPIPNPVQRSHGRIHERQEHHAGRRSGALRRNRRSC